MLSRLLFSIIFSIHVLASIAQNQQFSIDSKKAIKRFQSGMENFDRRNYEGAKKDLEEAIEIAPTFIEAHTVLGDLFMETGKMETATEHYKTAIQLNPDFFPQNYYNLGRAYMKLEKYDLAREAFKSTLRYKKLPPEVAKNSKKYLENADFAAEAVKHPVPFNPENLGENVNSPMGEYSPAITADDQELYFTFMHKAEHNENQGSVSRSIYQEDIYVSVKKDNKWTKAESVSPVINTPFFNEGALSISADGHTLYFTICNKTGDYGSCDIYEVKKYGEVWGSPKNLGPVVNSDKFESQPSISSDGLTLYFVSNRKGGQGGMDIWKTVKQANGEWGTPINLGPKINTAGTEQSPFIHADSRTLYYTSDGLPGMGEEDFFMSRMDENGEWQKAVNLGYPINSTGSERSLIINASGNKGYYASDKLKGIGQMDIYAFDVAEQIRPIRVAYVKGKVVNADNNQPVESRFELIDLANAKVVAEAYSDKVNGEFLICLPAEKNYALNVSKQGFLFYSENFSLKDNPQVKEALKMDIALKPIKLGQTMVLKNIFFNTNSYELKDESKAELEKLISFLNTNPKVKIEIGGHTDNVGDDKSNQVLSEKRALAVTEYLVAHGINKDKLTYKGYGESKPVASNETEEGRAQNRRTAFTIIAQ